MANRSEPSSGVEIRRAQGVGYLTLNRPAARNSLSAAMFSALLDGLAQFAADPSIGAVVLRGEGKSFCAGGDVQFFEQLLTLAPGERRAALEAYIGVAHRLILALIELPVPVLSAVQGAAAGYGVSLACAADVVIADSACAFIPAYGSLGTTPDGGMSEFLPRIIGERRAMDVLLFNRTITAADALQWGLVSKLCAAEELDRETSALAEALARGPRYAHRNLKRLIRGRAVDAFAEHLEWELQSFLACAATADFEAGVGAFLHRRAAVFGAGSAA